MCDSPSNRKGDNQGTIDGDIVILPGHRAKYRVLGTRIVEYGEGRKFELPDAEMVLWGVKNPNWHPKVNDYLTLKAIEGVLKGEDGAGYRPHPDDPYQVHFRGTAGGMVGMTQGWTVIKNGFKEAPVAAYKTYAKALAKARELNLQAAARTPNTKG